MPPPQYGFSCSHAYVFSPDLGVWGNRGVARIKIWEKVNFGFEVFLKLGWSSFLFGRITFQVERLDVDMRMCKVSPLDVR